MESTALRRQTMQAVKSKDTSIELTIRRLLYSNGYRYRLHDASLPGKPDIVFVGRRKVIFIHGCFWHGHDCLRGARLPKANHEYWSSKINRNRLRDRQTQASLEALGWKQLSLWECEMRNMPEIERRLRQFLE